MFCGKVKIILSSWSSFPVVILNVSSPSEVRRGKNTMQSLVEFSSRYPILVVLNLYLDIILNLQFTMKNWAQAQAVGGGVVWLQELQHDLQDVPGLVSPHAVPGLRVPAPRARCGLWPRHHAPAQVVGLVPGRDVASPGMGRLVRSQSCICCENVQDLHIDNLEAGCRSLPYPDTKLKWRTLPMMRNMRGTAGLLIFISNNLRYLSIWCEELWMEDTKIV